jgi:hypothetical protein
MKSTHYNNREHALGSKTWIKFSFKKHTRAIWDRRRRRRRRVLLLLLFQNSIFKLDSQSFSRHGVQHGEATRASVCGKLIFVMSVFGKATSSR